MSGLESSFSLHTMFPVDLSLRISLGIFLHFPISFFELIVLHVNGFFLFLFIRVYHVAFQVYSKMIQLYKYIYLGFPLGSVVKELPCNEGDLGSVSGLGTYAQRKMMSFSSILAWRISWTDEPSRLQSIGSQRVGHIESTERAQAHIHISIPLQTLFPFMLLQNF